LTPGWRLRATLAAFVFPPLLHVAPLDRIAGWIARRRMPAQPDDGVDDRALAEWVDRVLVALPPPWRKTCLKRALVLHYLTHRAGRPTELRVGVRRDDLGALAAHAWLVRANALYLEPSASQIDSYQLLTAFPAIGDLEH
jgi:hypothetical protein